MDFLNVMFPKSCLQCGKRGVYLCKECTDKVDYASTICPMCSKPSIDGLTHTKCQTPHGIDGLVTVWAYKGIVRKVITQIKFQFSYDIARQLGKRTFEHLKRSGRYYPMDCIIAPIPLHKKRKRWRGFNQADLIAKELAVLLNCEYVPDLLIRTKSGTPQTKTITKDQRLANVRGIFAINMRRKSLLKRFETIVLFDDVWTTGATMREAGKVLKRNGVKVVWGMTLAH